MQLLKFHLGKIIGTILGTILGGALGFLVGLLIGAMIDKLFPKARYKWLERKAPKNSHAMQPNDFIVSAILLAAVVVKSDGKIEELELSYVRAFLAEQFGSDEISNYWAILQQALHQDFDLIKTSRNIRISTTYETRLQLIYLLFGVANADFKLDEKEIATIKIISLHLGLQAQEYDSIKAMFAPSSAANYQILGLSPSCSDSALKVAYRSICQQFHPDKLQSLGPAVTQAGQAKFMRVKTAYESIKNDRGIF